MKDLTKGPIIKGLLLFTLPLLLGNFFQLLYSAVDTLIVGQTLGKNALAAVGATGSITFLILGFAQGMTSGLTIITAQKFGAKDEHALKRSFFCGLVLTSIVSLILGLMSVLFIKDLLRLMQTPEAIFSGAATFLSLMLGGMLFANLFNFFSSALRAIGDSKTPLIALIIASLANIALEYLAILGFHWGIFGAGVATLTAQAISVIYLAVYIAYKVPAFHIKPIHTRFDSATYKEHGLLAFPMGFQSSIIAIGSITLQVALNTLGTNAVATQSIVSKIDQFAMLPMISIGLATATFAAQNYGAKQFSRINQGLKIAVMIAIGWAILFALTLNLASYYFTTAFISPKEIDVINLSAKYYLINGAGYWILAILFVTRSTIQGLGNSLIPTIAGSMELVFRGIVAIIGAKLANYMVVIIANPAAWVGSVLILIPTTLMISKQFKQDLPLKTKS